MMKFYCISILCVITIFLVSCTDISKNKTKVEIEDNNRHYYPILAGDIKDISFNLKNIGNHPLIITDIITSCGCLNVDGDSDMFTIPAGKERILTLSYNSSKNVGYVKHYITLYGNFEDALMKELVFDINVVPNALYTKDYEELYLEDTKAKGGKLKEFVDGSANNKGYFVD